MADSSNPSGHVAEAMKLIVPHVAGFAGSVLALAFLDNLTPRGRIVAVAVGLASSIWLPGFILWVASIFVRLEMTENARSGLAFLVGLCAMGVLPRFLEWAKRWAGDPFSLLRLRAPGGGS